MILIYLFKLILVFPFIITLILYMQNVSEKQRGFFMTPLYLITTCLILFFTFNKLVAFALLCAFIGIFFLYVFQLVKVKYRKIYPSYIIRTFLIEYGVMFPKIYIALIVLGGLYRSFVGV